MNDHVVFAKTAKGRAEAANTAPSTLGSQPRVLLTLIDGKSALGELRKKALGNVPANKVQATIDALLTQGYIENAGTVAPEDNDLDFTYPGSAKLAPQPTPEQMANALNITLPGMPGLRRDGYYVNITKRPADRIPPRSGNKYEALIIDSDQSAVLLFARTMMLAGFNVRSASNREEIVGELRKPPLPDVLMLDTALPGLNGLDLLTRIHQHPQLAIVPIIVINTTSEPEEVAAAQARGASGYMTKPCKPEALRDSVYAVLGLK